MEMKFQPLNLTLLGLEKDQKEDYLHLKETI